MTDMTKGADRVWKAGDRAMVEVIEDQEGSTLIQLKWPGQKRGFMAPCSALRPLPAPAPPPGEVWVAIEDPEKHGRTPRYVSCQIGESGNDGIMSRYPVLAVHRAAPVTPENPLRARTQNEAVAESIAIHRAMNAGLVGFGNPQQTRDAALQAEATQRLDAMRPSLTGATTPEERADRKAIYEVLESIMTKHDETWEGGTLLHLAHQVRDLVEKLATPSPLAALRDAVVEAALAWADPKATIGLGDLVERVRALRAAMTPPDPLSVAKNALVKLACLGNGDMMGNSEGNKIAQAALDELATIAGSAAP